MFQVVVRLVFVTDKIETFLMGFLVGFSMWNACSRIVGLYLGEHYKKLSSYTYSGSPSKNLSVYDFNPESVLTLSTYKSYVGERTMQIYHCNIFVVFFSNEI